MADKNFYRKEKDDLGSNIEIIEIINDIADEETDKIDKEVMAMDFIEDDGELE